MNGKPERAGLRTQLFRNWISLSGMVVTAGSMFAFVLLFAIELIAAHGNPYVGILTFVVAPMFFFMGVGLMFLGVWMDRRRLPGAPPLKISVDLSRSRDKKFLVVFIFCTAGFLLLTALGSYKTYHYTEANQFCGATCHVPMHPEYAAYKESPHARVECVECHVGPGATWYIKSKFNGVHQLLATIKDDFHRPIKTPIDDMRPARDTCEQCHWPEKFTGSRDLTYESFLADEENTPFSVRLLLFIGGGETEDGRGSGIHWHVNPDNKVEYVATDEQRQEIPWVRLTQADGTVTEYRKEGFTEDPANYAIRTMDCVDCHNRPAHQYLAPTEAVDEALARGRINSDIPWVKSNVVHHLIQPYETNEEGLRKINEGLRASYPNLTDVESLVAEVQSIFRRNIFPEMKADWRAYPDNIGHKIWPGCFRCHDGSHESQDGQRRIAASDCNSCHTILAQGRGEELLQLNAEGHDFYHIDMEYLDADCHTCHDGAFMQ